MRDGPGAGATGNQKIGDPMIRVIVADDHDLVREGIKKILLTSSEIKIVGEAQDGLSALELLRSHPADVLILDISLPGISGLDLLQDMKKSFKKTAVLIVSMHAEERFALRAVRNGASGYLTKEKAGESLIDAVRKLAGGGRYITPALADRLAEEVQHPAHHEPHEALSDREFQVFLLLAAGRSVSSVAEELHLSVTTVSTYRARILEKMALASNADMTQYAYSRKLLE